MKALEIDLTALPHGKSQIDAEVPPGELQLEGEDFEFAEPLRVDLEVDVREKEIAFSGWILAPGRTECSRCLTPFDREIRAPFTLSVHRVEGDSPVWTEEGEDETTRLLPRATVRLDITDDVRSALLLALPIRFLCREDCRGLCPRCGVDLNQGACDCAPLNVDPRWEALRGLRRPSTS